MADEISADDWLQQAVVASNEGRHPQARDAFARALDLEPDLGDALLGLGLSYMATRDFKAAVAPLRQAAATPDAPAIWHACLAQGLYMTGDFAGCAKAFEDAAALEPLATNARLTHARARTFASMVEGDVEAALARYPALAGDEAEDIEVIAHEAFAILGVFGHVQAAAAVGAWRLARKPDDHIQAYLLQAVTGATVDRAPAAYVEAHFDSFADNFDRQLVDLLNYRAPERLARLVEAHESRFAEILDLGCGTGLSAPALAGFGGRLTGVDLSRGMLDKAAERGGYDRLVQAEATTFLEDHPAAFDLIFATDVLIYFGDLEPLLRAAERALKPGGVLAVSTEVGAEGWTLLTSGRFAHADAYVDHATGSGLERLAREPILLRHEGVAPVEGALHVLRKRAVA